MNFKTLIASAALLLPLLSLAGNASDAQSIAAARRAQNAAIAQHRLDEVASYWTEDVTICRALGAQSVGKSAYRALFEADDRGAADALLYQRQPVHVSVSAIWPLAFESGTWTGRRGGLHGEAVIRGRYSAQWVKRGERWLIRSEVFVALAGSGAGLALRAVP